MRFEHMRQGIDGRVRGLICSRISRDEKQAVRRRKQSCRSPRSFDSSRSLDARLASPMVDRKIKPEPNGTAKKPPGRRAAAASSSDEEESPRERKRARKSNDDEDEKPEAMDEDDDEEEVARDGLIRDKDG